MYKYKKFDNEDGLSFFSKLLIALFVMIYPLFVSIYTMFPPLIGLAGYFLIVNLRKEKFYLFASLFYLLNLDLNRSLPLLLSTLIIILVYMFLYNQLSRLVRCRVCLLFTLIITIDFLYYLSLFIYDFMFNGTTILADMLLVYYIAIDILIGVLL